MNSQWFSKDGYQVSPHFWEGTKERTLLVFQTPWYQGTYSQLDLKHQLMINMCACHQPATEITPTLHMIPSPCHVVVTLRLQNPAAWDGKGYQMTPNFSELTAKSQVVVQNQHSRFWMDQGMTLQGDIEFVDQWLTINDHQTSMMNHQWPTQMPIIDNQPMVNQMSNMTNDDPKMIIYGYGSIGPTVYFRIMT